MEPEAPPKRGLRAKTCGPILRLFYLSLAAQSNERTQPPSTVIEVPVM